ncbi:MAG TPA: hypothetical protein PLM96_09810 [Methanoregulaceae archaeon]|jgi:hypothetical protein|nr:hypothetical protein [Methanoregulaceae archaeon]MDD5048937.1 hypothetical protein [Methanoregulaceae archaeon]MDD5685095.1 hypothetical protein [Methanoregulaceae archaeon]HOP67981.1 hypothetical protein [Methanoregulaceae archaeon]HPJ75081.1 hypothetical protein [Methanoregulaceae archaeon]
MKQDAETTLVCLICVIFAGYGIQSVLIGDTFRLIAVLLPSVILTLIPVIAEKQLQIRFPAGVKSLVALALLLHVAGGISRFYWIFAPVYDKLAHVVSAAAVAMLVFVLFIILDYYNHRVKTPLMFVAIVAISVFFMLAWEVGEYYIDMLVKSSYNNGLLDTICDLFADMIGLVIGLLLVRHHIDSLSENESLNMILFERQLSE